MSKPRQIKRKKKSTGFINLTPPSQFRHTFATFAAFAAWARGS
jgi:hypothetical protein